jgi:polyisoprenyl-phosphate glycosyltransferase
MKKITIVIPIFNEEQIIPILIERLQNVISKIKNYNFEVIFIDDGSIDNSVDIISSELKAIETNFLVKIIELSRNFGHQGAVTCGIDNASGDALIMMDADLQDPPELIPDMINSWEKGNHVVHCVKNSRNEPIFKRIMFYLFYFFQNFLVKRNGPNSGIFSLTDRKVYSHLRLLTEKRRFIPGLRNWVGFKNGYVEFDRPNRIIGEPKVKFSSLVRLAFDAILTFSKVPLKLILHIGSLTFIVSFFIISFYVFKKFYLGQNISVWVFLLLSQTLLSGVVLLSIGILGEYLGIIFDEIKNRPSYIIKNESIAK